MSKKSCCLTWKATSIKKNLPEFAGAIIVLACGMLSGHLAHSGDTEWYQSLQKPFFNPPSWIFAPIWMLLYLGIGFAAGQLWKNLPKTKYQLTLLIFNLALNFTWSPIFFGLHEIDFAFYNILAIWITALLILKSTQPRSIIFIIFCLYLAWITFATILNGYIFLVN